ncbi:MAG: protein-glutamate O-methyltransferase family protein [Treponema sp.]|nr:protein-glutamate O-methyltransferase family protein [Treponema sp.]
METNKKPPEYFFIGKDEVQDLGKESFAHFTARTRFHKIFSEHCSGDYEKDFLEKTVNEALKPKESDNPNSYSLLDKCGLEQFMDIVNGKIPNPSDGHSKIELSEKNTLKDFFDNAPFFESEVLFYHALLAQKKYFSNQYDFFATEKKDSLENSRDAFIKKLGELPSPGTQDGFTLKTFRTCIQYCLSANTSDLSQLNAKERFDYGMEDVNLLHDDTEVLFQYLNVNKKFKRFDIICDNAGKELFSDLYLACYFLSNNIVDKVVFHLKPYPFFVSDATKEDFGFMMNAIMRHGGTECAAKCNNYIHEGKIEIEDDMFWAAPYCFKKMPEESKLREQLCNSDLIIVKGDLNYRRLVEDKNWPYTDSFLERTKGVFGDVPIFAPRVIKSDVLVGVSEAAYHTAKSSDSHGAPADQRFKGSGKWAVVHFRCNRYDHYKKEAQKEKEKASQSKHNGADDSKNAETKPPATNAREQQNTKNPDHEKKNRFYITINICYTMAIVLILAMLAVSTIPVIAQTISMAHENSDLTKTQKTEHLQETQKNQSALILINNDSSEQSEPQQNVKAAELKYGDVAGRIDFTLLLTGYAIFITGTLFIPKVLLKKEVEEGLEKYAKEIAKKTVDERFQERIKSTQNELYRMDAHFSRMFAFQLHENYPVWSVGWAYRSLKRYKNLDSKKTGFIEYRDFIRFLEEGVIASSIKKFHDKVAEKFQSEHLYESYHREMFPLASAQHILEEEETKAKEENLRPALRAVKDISDFEYAVRFDKSNEIGEIEIGILQHIAMCAGLFARELCAVILWHYSKDKANPNLHGSTYDSETMMQELLKISNYGEKSDVKQEVKQKFQQMLKQTLQQIAGDRKNAPYDYYDIKNYYDTENRPILMYFFVDEESSHLKG